MTLRPLRRGALTAVAATLLLAGPAAAHPFFEPNEAPVDSAAELTLDLAHGCGLDDHDAVDTDDGASEQPTREVAIEVPDVVGWVDATEADGWDLDLERHDAGDVEVVVYTARDGTDVPAPAFDLEAVHEGEVGDEVHWRVMQACDDTTERWVGTPDEPAEDPAVALTLVEEDPDAPPPAPEEADGDTSEGESAAASDQRPDDDADAPVAGDDQEPGSDAEEAAIDEAEEPATDTDEGGLPGWSLIVVLVVALAIAGGVLLLRSRGATETQRAGTDHDGTDQDGTDQDAVR